MRVDEVPDRGVSADEDEPPEGGTDAAGFEQPEQPLDRDIEDRLGRLLARRQVKHMGDALGSGVDDVAAVDRARDNLEPRRRLQQPVVAQRSDPDPGEPLVARGEHPPDERLADLAGRAGDQDQRRLVHAASMTITKVGDRDPARKARASGLVRRGRMKPGRSMSSGVEASWSVATSADVAFPDAYPITTRTAFSGSETAIQSQV